MSKRNPAGSGTQKKDQFDHTYFLTGPSEVRFQRANILFDSLIKSLTKAKIRMEYEDDLRKQEQKLGAGPSVSPAVTLSEKIKMLQSDIEYVQNIVKYDSLVKEKKRKRIETMKAVIEIVRRNRQELYLENLSQPGAPVYGIQVAIPRPNQPGKRNTSAVTGSRPPTDEQQRRITSQSSNKEMKKRPRASVCSQCNLIIR